MSTAMTALQVADFIQGGSAEVMEVRWYRNNPAERKILVTVQITNELMPRCILLAEGSHPVYHTLKGAAE